MGEIDNDIMRKAARPHAIRKTSGPETRVSLGVALVPSFLLFSLICVKKHQFVSLCTSISNMK